MNKSPTVSESRIRLESHWLQKTLDWDTVRSLDSVPVGNIRLDYHPPRNIAKCDFFILLSNTVVSILLGHPAAKKNRNHHSQFALLVGRRDVHIQYHFLLKAIYAELNKTKKIVEILAPNSL